MDNAVALVQAYLQVNGYFTVAEYPVLDINRHGTTRSVTDWDILGFRLPGAGRELRLPHHHREVGPASYEPDPVLLAVQDKADLIVGEVKRGRAHFNPPAHDPVVVAAALMRFGCCQVQEARGIARELLAEGRVDLDTGYSVRMVAFGVPREGTPTHPWLDISMKHVVEFLRSYLQEHWEVLRHVQLGNPAFDFLGLIHRAEMAPREKPHEEP